MKKTVLIIDDDALLRKGLAYTLNRAGYDVVLCESGEEGLQSIQSKLPDLILLDIGLPDRDGLEVLRAMQRETQIPVIFVTARRRELDEIVGLDLGAEDYITKPFDMDILLARIRVVLRRNLKETGTSSAITVGDLKIDADAHVVELRSRNIEVTPKQFAVLFLLAQKAGLVVTTEDILQHVWGDEWVGEPQTIYVHIRWLREKLEADPANPRRIITIKGVGYKLLPITE